MMLGILQDSLINSRYPWFRDLSINIYGYFLKRKRFSDNFHIEINYLEKLESLSASEIAQIQSEQLRILVQHAYNNVPFYRERFNEYGVLPNHIQNIEDINQIPLLSRDDIRTRHKELIAVNIPSGSYSTHHTSGSTGLKLTFSISNHLQWAVKFAHLYRHYSWAGIHPGDRRATLGGRKFAASPPYWVYNRPENQLLLSIHHMSLETIDDYITQLHNYRPVLVQGHPSGLTRLAERMLSLDRSFQAKAIFTTGESLFNEQRTIMKQAFMCPVFDFYGQGEGLFYAGECEQHVGLHEFSSMGLIELLPPMGNGNSINIKRVVGTGLHNFAMPMIRYELGDLAIPAKQQNCSCGRPLPVKIEQVLGRTDDRIYLSQRSDDYLLPVTVRMHIKPLLQEGQNYQVRQDSLDHITLYLTSSYRVSSNQKAKLSEVLRELTGKQKIRVDVAEVGNIATDGGKIRNVVSDIAKEFGQNTHNAERMTE